MKSFNDTIDSLNNNQNSAYAFIRTFIGIALFVRGYLLFSDPEAIMKLVGDDQLHMWFSYVTIGHLVGGFFMAIGVFTRLGALIQIPLLAGAVFVVHDKSLLQGSQSLELAVLVLFLLVVCFIYGGGKNSLGKRFNLASY
ncbi:MAG: DoxX family protein [Bacteroidetes bacterium]|nr:MAG: DoxX family protein [Bacteroidota bacterium]